MVTQEAAATVVVSAVLCEPTSVAAASGSHFWFETICERSAIRLGLAEAEHRSSTERSGRFASTFVLLKWAQDIH